MPWGIRSIREIQQRPSMQAMTRGGYQLAEMPDPNSAMSTFQRAQGVSSVNPSVLREQAAAEDLAAHERFKQYEAAERKRNKIRNIGINPVEQDRMRIAQLRQAQWTPFMQALKNIGADRLQTGAAAGWDSPGFFEEQRPSMMGLQNAAQMGRQNAIDAFMSNYAAGAYQDMRRR